MGDDYLSNEDFGYLCRELTAAFGADYIKPDSTEHYKAKQVFQIACSEGMTKKEFRDGVRSFLQNQCYPNWLPGHFFKYLNIQRLHPDSWAIKEVRKTPEAKNFMEGYRFTLNGRKITLWRYADGQELPFKKIYPKPEQKSEVKALIPDIDDETLKSMNMTKKYLEEKTKAEDWKMKCNDLRENLEYQSELIRQLEENQKVDISEYERMKEANLNSAKIILELQEKIGKLKVWIMDQIKEKSTEEQLNIWNKIWEKEEVVDE